MNVAHDQVQKNLTVVEKNQLDTSANYGYIP